MDDGGVGSRVLPSGTVCFLFTDVESSTTILRDIGDEAWAAALGSMHRIIRNAVETNGGTLVNTEGDGCFAAFPTTDGAVRACTDAQKALHSFAWGAREVRVRMGLHVGVDIAPVHEDYVALAVHKAARVANAASGLQVLATADVVKAGSPHEFTDLGLFNVRDFDGPVRLYGLEFDGVVRVVPRVPPAFDHQVPSYRTGLVGRDTEIADVLALATPGSLVTLIGPIGVGKTRIAIAALAQLSAHCPVGPWFVDLREARERRDVGDVLARAIGCPPAVEIDAHLDALLDGRRGVLVLDSCDHLAEAAASTADLLLDWCPTLTVIATAHEPLGLSSEAVYAIAPLEEPASAEAAEILDSTAGRLLVERLTLLAPDLELSLDDIRTICAKTDGSPLAIELAATLCSRRAPADVAALADIAALIEANLDDLAPTDLRALAALTVPHHPVSAGLAQAALSAVDATPDALERLVAGSLIDSDLEGRLSQLAPIRERTTARLDPHDREAVVRALLAECLTATAGDTVPLARIDPIADTASALVHERVLPVVDRQRLAVRLAPWWIGRLGGERARAELELVLALDPGSNVAAAVHLAIADTYETGRATSDTEQHLRDAGRLLGEHDAVDPALIERLRAATEREATEPGS